MKSTSACCDNIARLKQELDTADAVVIGAGSGLSTSAGFTYTGERFEKFFGDFHFQLRPVSSGAKMSPGQKSPGDTREKITW